MKQFLTVFKFTYMDAVRKKSFRVSTIIIFAIILIACLIPRVVGLFDSGDDGDMHADTAQIAETSDAYEDGTSAQEPVQFADRSPIYYLDADGLIPNGASALQSRFIFNLVTEITEDGFEDARKVVVENGDTAIVQVTKLAGDTPKINVIVKDFMSGVSTSAVTEALSSAWSAEKLAAMGVTAEQIALAQTSLFTTTEAVGTMNVAGYALGIIFTMLMFFAVYFYGLGVANSVSTEKTSRVMETLVVSAKPRNILIGKCVAMGAVGLTQLIALIAFAFGCYTLLVPAGTALFGMELSFTGVTVGSILLLIVYFLLGYALYALLYAVSGASVSRIEDVSSALMPVSMFALIGFYIGYFTTLLGETSGIMDKISMYVPICSPFGMPFRILNQTVGAGDLCISIGILLITIVFVAIITSKLYAASVMFYGKRLKLKDMLKLKP